MEAPGGLLSGWEVNLTRLIVIAVTMGVAYLMYRNSRSTPPSSSSRTDCGCGGESCADILKERYEKGLIRRDDYERIKKGME